MKERIHSIKDLERSTNEKYMPTLNKWVARFLSGFELDISTECWNWRGTVNSVNGYGRTTVHSRAVNIHRLSWIFFNGEIPFGVQVLHKCDNRKCGNPKHLFLGTPMINIHDCISKGRNITGSNHKNSKIKEEDVISIRKMAHSGIRHRIISNSFGITKKYVSQIVTRDRWAHLK